MVTRTAVEHHDRRLKEDFQAANDTSEKNSRRGQSALESRGVPLAQIGSMGRADYWERCGDRTVTWMRLLERCEVIVMRYRCWLLRHLAR